MEHFCGKGTVIDVTGLSTNTITVKHLKKHEAVIKSVDFILLKTGWSQHWGQDSYYGDFPVLDEAAAAWLTSFRLKGIGIDAISVDVITSTTFPIHRILLGQGILIVENLTNLHLITEKFFHFYCMPLKIQDADGSPIRAISVP